MSPQRWLPTVIGAAVFGIALAFLYQQLEDGALHDVLAALSSIRPTQLQAAIALTALNYLVLTGYDWLAMRYVGASLGWRQIAPTSFVAFAIGHSVGFAALSGGALRFRAYSAAGLSMPQIARVIGFCTIGFLLGCCTLLGGLMLEDPGIARRAFADSLPPITVHALSGLLLSVPLAYLFWSRYPRATLRFRRMALEPPATRLAASQIVIACLDLSIASAVLWVLLPDADTPAFAAFLGIYLMAIAITLLSNVPGGLGVFEGAVVLLLRPDDVAAVLATLLAFRALFYLLPFSLAMLTLGVQLLNQPKG